MKVIKSKITGYCHGVEHTIKSATQVLRLAKKKNLPAYSLGKLIHNDDVVKGFEMQGLHVINDFKVEPGVALIRAHGIPEELYQEYESRGFCLVDSTCQNIHATKDAIRVAESRRRKVFVVGVKSHDETKTLLGCGSDDKIFISSLEEAKNVIVNLNPRMSVSVAVQTTFPEHEFNRISMFLNSYFLDINYLNKLCMACKARKTNGLKLAEKCDVLFVVGGKESANTKELAQWIKQSGKPVYLVENQNDFDERLDNEIRKYSTAGVCSGTSTPHSIIDGVVSHLDNL